MILAPWKDGNRSAYHRVTDLTTLADDAKRRRKLLDFIATDEALAAVEITCPVCGDRVTDDGGERGNRGEYNPRTKRINIWHYYCSWERILGPGGLLEDLLNRRNR